MSNLIIDGKVVQDSATTTSADGTQFPAGFFTDQEAVGRAGLEQAPEIQYPNEMFYTWVHNSDGTITVTPKPLEDCIAYVSGLVTDLRAKKMGLGGCKVLVGTEEKWFHSDAVSKTQQLGLERQASNALAEGKDESYILKDDEGDIYWKTMNKSFVPMTVKLAKDVFQAAFLQDSAIFRAAVKHTTAIQGKHFVPELEVYDYTIDWPETFNNI